MKEEYRTYYKIIGAFFKSKRAETHYTIQNVADMMHRSKGWYGDAERGRSSMTVEDCMKLCDIYNTNLGEVDKYLRKHLPDYERVQKSNS